MNIIENKVTCVHCNTQLFSYVNGGYAECVCGKVAISGGKEKLIRYSPESDFIEESIIEIDTGENRKKV